MHSASSTPAVGPRADWVDERMDPDSRMELPRPDALTRAGQARPIDRPTASGASSSHPHDLS